MLPYLCATRYTMLIKMSYFNKLFIMLIKIAYLHMQKSLPVVRREEACDKARLGHAR